MNTEHLEVNERKFIVKVHYEHRHSSRVSIGGKAINIRIPSFLNRDEKYRELLRMKMWAIENIKENPERFKPEQQKDYKDGEALKVANEDYQLKIEFKEKESSSARLVGNTIEMAISSKLTKEKQNKHISALLSRIIAMKRLWSAPL